ncbi:hypothetical protein TNCV_856841 [Trichonephila clavipes]|nr:hypothetical protein TNCV_856841 [Trichonephila clavipes]
MADLLPRNRVVQKTTSQRGDTSQTFSTMRSPSSTMLLCSRNWNQVLIPPSSIWCCHWPGVATWRMVVGGVSDARTNGVASE